MSLSPSLPGLAYAGHHAFAAAEDRFAMDRTSRMRRIVDAAFLGSDLDGFCALDAEDALIFARERVGEEPWMAAALPRLVRVVEG